MKEYNISNKFIEYSGKFNDNQLVSQVLKFFLNQKININVLDDKIRRDFVGLSTLYGIYFDLKRLDEQPDNLKCFIILHELAHVKRIKKLGKNKVISDLSETNFDLFCDKVINEEIIADRYASLLYFKLTKKKYPEYMTQGLHIKSKRDMYKQFLKFTFGLNDGTEETYKKKLKEVFKIDV